MNVRNICVDYYILNHINVILKTYTSRLSARCIGACAEVGPRRSLQKDGTKRCKYFELVRLISIESRADFDFGRKCVLFLEAPSQYESFTKPGEITSLAIPMVFRVELAILHVSTVVKSSPDLERLWAAAKPRKGSPTQKDWSRADSCPPSIKKHKIATRCTHRRREIFGF